MPRRKRVFTTFEAAEYCQVSPFTVRNWIETGALPAYKTPGGHRRILKADLDAFLQRHGMPSAEMLSGVKRILVVDDDETVTSFVSRVVKQLDEKVQVETALNGFEAGSMIAKFKPHVVVLDLKMPGLDGFEVCRRIKSDEATSHATVIGITGYYTPAHAKRFAECGGWQLLKKPLDVNRLMDVVREALSIHWSRRR